MALRSLITALLRRRVLQGMPLADRQTTQLLSLRSFTYTSFLNDASERDDHSSANVDPSSAETTAADLASGESGAEGSERAKPSEQGIAEAIMESYIYTEEDEKKDWETVRRAANEAHEEMNRIFGDEKQREPRRPTINLAGEGRAGWQNWYRNDETHEALWMLDLTAGKVPDNEKNALLCQESKMVMLEMAKDGVPIEEIAEFFRVRQQRVIAILALQKIDSDREKAGKEMYTDYEHRMEGGWGSPNPTTDPYFDCTEIFGSGERHVRWLPKAPHYEKKVDEKGNVSHRNLEELEEELGEREEKVMVEEFTDRLLYNMGLVGKNLRRDLTKAHRPKRPKKGFSLLVKPKGSNEKPYVAEPDGNLRDLNKDEQVLQRRRRVRPRRRLL